MTSKSSATPGSAQDLIECAQQVKAMPNTYDDAAQLLADYVLRTVSETREKIAAPQAAILSPGSSMGAPAVAASSAPSSAGVTDRDAVVENCAKVCDSLAQMWLGRASFKRGKALQEAAERIRASTKEWATLWERNPDYMPSPTPPREPSAQNADALKAAYHEGYADALKDGASAAPAVALKVKEGESLWLIETSELAVKGDPTYPQRHFWTGDPCSRWHHDPLKAARYPMKESAENAAEEAKLYPRDKYPVCEHLFQCGTSVESAIEEKK